MGIPSSKVKSSSMITTQGSQQETRGAEGRRIFVAKVQCPFHTEKSRIRETKNLSTNSDSRTDKILERLLDLS